VIDDDVRRAIESIYRPTLLMYRARETALMRLRFGRAGRQKEHDPDPKQVTNWHNAFGVRHSNSRAAVVNPGPSHLTSAKAASHLVSPSPVLTGIGQVED
jgi:hypothetical protein